jgi:hypothetical protein
MRGRGDGFDDVMLKVFLRDEKEIILCCVPPQGDRGVFVS